MTQSHHPRLWQATVSAILLLAASVYGGPTQDMLAAIEKGKANLWTKLNADGNWELVPARAGDSDQGLEGNQWGGQTAMVVYTLLNAGVDRNDARIKKAVEFLMQAKITGTYALSLRAMVWPKLQRTPAVVAAAKRDADQLWAMRRTEGKGKGFYSYKDEGKDGRFDLSNSQFAVLGLWSCAQVLPELPYAMWKGLDDAWREQQTAEGRWYYQPGKNVEGKATMTIAGVATLYIMQDMLSIGRAAECNGNINDAAIDKGMAWLAANRDIWLEAPGWQPNLWTMEHYALYAISRVGIASGRKYIGGTDWLKLGAEKMVKGQKDDGSWGGVPNTCFAVLFLSRGGAPVAINKLEYAIDTGGDRPKPANWNERPRDAANIVKWLSEELERNLNWQIVDLKADPGELLDAPVLYIAGNQPLSFSKDE